MKIRRMRKITLDADSAIRGLRVYAEHLQA